MHGATFLKDSSIKSCIVRDKKLDVSNPIKQHWPQFAEGRRIQYIRPTDSMNSGEFELWRRRTNQERPNGHNLARLPRCQTYRTRAIPATIGCFEVNRYERTHGIA